jgi:ABC-2 type transport system ATP-binding protein
MNNLINSTSNPAIECVSLSKQYRQVKALDDLNLTVATGSVFGFLGTNGAGKTTTIQLICSLTHPTAGKVFIQGMDVLSHEMAVKKTIGYLPQSPRFYGWMTPTEMLNYIGKLHHESETHRKLRTAEVLEIVNLQKSANRRIGGFSGGMLQRLGIAQAIYHRPSILLLDEPTSSLDPAGRYEVLELIRSLNNQMTVFLSSHILDDVQRICDTIAILNEGKLVLQADVATLLRKTVSDTVRIEVLDQHQAVLTSFEQVLRQKSWVVTIKQKQNSLTITVNNPDEIKTEILQLCLQQEIKPEKLEWLHPSLEDIFLKVSKKHE